MHLREFSPVDYSETRFGIHDIGARCTDRVFGDEGFIGFICLNVVTPFYFVVRHAGCLIGFNENIYRIDHSISFA